GRDPRKKPERRGEGSVPLDSNIDAQELLPRVADQSPERGRIGIVTKIPGAGEVSREPQHSERLPSHAGGVAPEVGDRLEHRKQRVRAPFYRHSKRGELRLVLEQPAGEAYRGRCQVHERPAQPLSTLAILEEPGQMVHQTTEIETEPASPRNQRIGRVVRL